MALDDASGPPVLLGNALERVEGVVDVKPVEVDHSSEAIFALDAEGRKWVRKKMVATGWQPLLAEALGWLVAKELGIRVPPGAICGAGDELSWLSGYVPHTLHWQRNYAHFVKNIDEFGAMLTLDAVIYNDDRHAKNILVVPDETEENFVAWSIDVGNARVGYPKDFAELGLDIPTKPNIARGLPVELMKVGAFGAAQRAAKLASSQRLQRYVSEACELVGEDTAALLSEALSNRLEHAGDLVENYIKVIEGIP